MYYSCIGLELGKSTNNPAQVTRYVKEIMHDIEQGKLLINKCNSLLVLLSSQNEVTLSKLVEDEAFKSFMTENILKEDEDDLLSPTN